MKRIIVFFQPANAHDISQPSQPSQVSNVFNLNTDFSICNILNVSLVLKTSLGLGRSVFLPVRLLRAYNDARPVCLRGI